MIEKVPNDIDTTLMWFVVRCDARKSKDAEEEMAKLMSEDDSIVFYSLPDNDCNVRDNKKAYLDNKKAYLMQANIWNYLDPMKPFLKTINRKVWKSVFTLPGFKDFGSSEYSVVPHQLDCDALSSIMNMTNGIVTQAFLPKIGEEVEITDGAFEGSTGKVVKETASGFEVEISIFGKTMQIEVPKNELSKPSA